VVIHEGEVGSLQRFKDQAKEVIAGFECGMSILKFNDIKEGDIFECFAMEEIKR
jgi:translation initiation factor IF-2